MKQCSKCHQTKSFSNFYKRSSSDRSRSRYQSWCKECKNSARREKTHPPIVPGESPAARLRRQKRESYKRRIEANPRLGLKNILKRKYGMSLEQWDQLMEEQNGKCYICHREPNEKETRLAVDHCHKTGQVRKLLCNSCNSALGFAGDSISRLEMLIGYLNEFLW